MARRGDQHCAIAFVTLANNRRAQIPEGLGDVFLFHPAVYDPPGSQIIVRERRNFIDSAPTRDQVPAAGAHRSQSSIRIPDNPL